VVAATLENLCQEALDAPAGAGDGRIEEHQAGFLRTGGSGGDDAPPCGGKPAAGAGWSKLESLGDFYPRDRSV
jgi:hypothetical protein